MAETAHEHNELELALRSELKHSLASPIRGISILSDLLAESLASAEVDMEAIREISDQLTTLTEDTCNRLASFSVKGA